MKSFFFISFSLRTFIKLDINAFRQAKYKHEISVEKVIFSRRCEIGNNYQSMGQSSGENGKVIFIAIIV